MWKIKMNISNRKYKRKPFQISAWKDLGNKWLFNPWKSCDFLQFSWKSDNFVLTVMLKPNLNEIKRCHSYRNKFNT